MERYPYGRDIMNALESQQGEDDTIEVRTLRPNEVYTKDVVSRGPVNPAAEPPAKSADSNRRSKPKAEPNADDVEEILS